MKITITLSNEQVRLFQAFIDYMNRNGNDWTIEEAVRTNAVEDTKAFLEKRNIEWRGDKC